jgi:hypothetical protein
MFCYLRFIYYEFGDLLAVRIVKSSLTEYSTTFDFYIHTQCVYINYVYIINLLVRTFRALLSQIVESNQKD